MAWVLNYLEPDCPAEMPSRLWWRGRAYRQRRQHRTTLATLFGPVVVWRRLYEPLTPGERSIHPLELRLGVEAGLATPALAERIGAWAVDHPQRQVLEMLRHDHRVHWSCTTLRKLLGNLSAGMTPHRHAAQVDHVISWLHQAGTTRGRFQPHLLWVAMASMCRCATANQGGIDHNRLVLDRRGKRLGTVYPGHMPDGQTARPRN